ncbi:solute carrier organic anion transporter family member 2A1-like [Haliotis rubra]|uniref:solute carrier organic anion transporter family member 2A1-like n=1 Tax=Haliotis rubra TaxID=36100 RepID=UPI001EE5E9EE|nr:solute carrier organic anion transporter family member 2A1-like [Haliotis rubra]
MSVCVLLTSTLNTYVNSQVTTLEKQFGLSSSETGLLMASNDIGYITVGIFISYFAPRVHIPRFLALSTVLFGISGIICSLPHFLYGVEQKSGDSLSENNTVVRNNFIGQLCLNASQSETDSCDSNEDGSPKPRDHATAAVAIIAMGMIIQGISKAPRHPFLVTFIDDNVVKTKTGYYLGIIITIAILGPAIAYSLGGLFTRIYVTLEATDLHPRHPKWVGAWWLGYIVFGAASILAAFPVFLFPRRLRGAPPPEEPVLKKTEVVKGDTNRHQVLKEIKNYCRILRNIMTNPIYVLLLFSTMSLIFGVGGLHSFMPKYIENQFGLEAWKANLIMAGLALSTASVGTFIGGWLTKRFKMGPMTAIKFTCFLYFAVVVFYGLGFVFGCEQPEIVNTPGSAATSCPSGCPCNDLKYFPVCGSDGRNYFSPCHAGCSFHEKGTYTNCTCIPGGEATSGSCEYDCPLAYPYFIAIGLSFLVSTMAIMPKIISEIRCVTEDEKPLSIGVMTVLASLFGWLLSPLVFGRVIDSSCLLWDSACEKRGACLLYDMADFRIKLHSLVLGARGVSFAFTCLACLVAIKTKKWEQKEEKETLKES